MKRAHALHCDLDLDCSCTPPTRAEAVTLPEIRVSRDTPTIPAPSLGPEQHEGWIEHQRAFCDLGPTERQLLTDIALELKTAPLDRGKRPATGSWWHLHAKFGGGPENFRSGRRD